MVPPPLLPEACPGDFLAEELTVTVVAVDVEEVVDATAAEAIIRRNVRVVLGQDKT